MPFQKLRDGQGDKKWNGKGRVWIGKLTLSSGTVQIDYDADLPDGPQNGSFENEPVIIPIGKADDALFLSSIGTSTATISDGSGSSSTEVQVLVIEDTDMGAYS